MKTFSLAFAACALLGLAACSEPPQEVAAAAEPGFKTDDWEQQMRERTLRQHESGRIYH